MRTVILAAISAAMVWGQQQGSREYQEQQAQERLEALRNRQRALVVRAAQLEALKADVATAEARLNELRTRYNDNYPDIVALKSKISELQTNRLFIEGTIKELEQAPSRAASAPPGADAQKLALPDRWWRNQVTVQYLGLGSEQQKKMDDVVEQFRAKLLTNNVILQAAETAMQPLVSVDPPDEAKITAQIDRVAEARAELEKTNGRMLLGLRKLLTPEQWIKLNQAFTMNLAQ